MKEYSVNEKFPVANPIPFIENVRSEINPDFIDVIYNITKPTMKEVNTWRFGKFKYGVFVESDIPFFLIDFGDWDFDMSLNILKCTNKEQRDNWLKTDGGWLFMYLIDACSNDIKAMRQISFSSTSKVKQVLQNQAKRYRSYSDVDIEIDKINSKYTTKDMIRKTKMIKMK